MVTPTVPSPVASVGCEPHGDHWHCDGPAETTTTAAELSGFTTSASATATSTRADEGNGTGIMSVQVSLMVGLAVVIAVLNL